MIEKSCSCTDFCTNARIDWIVGRILKKGAKLMYGHFSSLYPVDMIFKANSKGQLVIDEGSARSYLDFLLEDAKRGWFSPSRGRLSWSLSIYDDEKGYSGCEVYGLSPGKPSTVVTLSFSTDSFFRMKIFKKEVVERTASYQWEY